MSVPIQVLRRVPRRQGGMTTVLVSVLLLLIVSMIVLFSASVSVKEVRTGTNQYRATRAFDAAQQGLGLGLEFIRANRAVVASTSANGWLEQDLEQWEPCPVDGVVADDFPCDAERDPAVRASLFRYRGSTALPAAQRYRLPLAQPAALPAVDLDGDGTVDTTEAALRYRVGALLCLIDPATVTAGNVCDFPRARLADEAPQAYAVHMVARGAVMSADAAAGDLPEAVANGQPLAEARASVAQNYGSFRLIADGPDSPLIAANSIRVRGTFDIVANSNGGGFGVPISIWTASTIDDNGTPRTCHVQEFLLTNPADNELIDGTNVCDTCGCPREGSLTYRDGGGITRGPDIIDAVGNSQVTGQRNFPDDMFQYLFGVPKVDSDGNERWTEVKDRATLLDGTCSGDPLDPGCCADLGETSTGLFWSTEGTCAITSDVVGTPLEPVYLVVENAATARSERFFGVLYKFAMPGSTATVGLRFVGRGAVYGAVVIDNDGFVENAAGTFAIVYSSEVMSNLANSPGLLKVGPIPGSWTDLGTY